MGSDGTQRPRKGRERLPHGDFFQRTRRGVIRRTARRARSGPGFLAIRAPGCRMTGGRNGLPRVCAPLRNRIQEITQCPLPTEESCARTSCVSK